MQYSWVQRQVRSTRHLIALLGIFGIVFCAGFFRENMVVYVGYTLFFLVTAWSMLKTMILFSIIIGGLVALFPFLAPVALVIMVFFFFMRIGFVLKNWRPVIAGLVVYGFGVFLVYYRYHFLQYLLPTSVFHSIYTIIGAKILFVLPLTEAAICVLILHLLLVWQYRNGYNSMNALGIMGGVPLVLISFLLPFLKVFADSAAIDLGDIGHSGHGTTGEHVGYGAKPAPGYTYVKPYVRTAPDGIAENNLSAHGHTGQDVPLGKLEVVKGHWRSNPDGIAENNLSYHGEQLDPPLVYNNKGTGQESIKVPWVYDVHKQGTDQAETAKVPKVANPKYLAAGILVALIALGGLYQYWTRSDVGTKQPVMSVPSVQNTAKITVSADKPPKQIKPLDGSDFVLANIKPGNYIQDVRRNINEPLREERGKNATIYKAMGRGIELTILDAKSGRISGIVIDKNTIPSSRGVMVGDSVSKVIAAYGDAVISSYENYDLYEYLYSKEAKYVLRFAVGKSSKVVEYMGLRAGDN